MGVTFHLGEDQVSGFEISAHVFSPTWRPVATRRAGLREGKALRLQQPPRHCQPHEVPLAAGINTPGRERSENGNTRRHVSKKGRPSAGARCAVPALHPCEETPRALRSVSARPRAGPGRPGRYSRPPPRPALAPAQPAARPLTYASTMARERCRGAEGGRGGARKRNSARPSLLHPSLFLALSLFPLTPLSLPLSRAFPLPPSPQPARPPAVTPPAVHSPLPTALASGPPPAAGNTAAPPPPASGPVPPGKPHRGGGGAQEGRPGHGQSPALRQTPRLQPPRLEKCGKPREERDRRTRGRIEERNEKSLVPFLSPQWEKWFVPPPVGAEQPRRRWSERRRTGRKKGGAGAGAATAAARLWDRPRPRWWREPSWASPHTGEWALLSCWQAGLVNERQSPFQSGRVRLPRGALCVSHAPRALLQSRSLAGLFIPSWCRTQSCPCHPGTPQTLDVLTSPSVQQLTVVWFS